jgi:hypothetical protein
MSKQANERGTATRRGFLAVCAGVAFGVVGGLRPGWARTTRSPLPLSTEGCHGFVEAPLQTEHPEPRPGIDASGVLTHDDLADAPHAIPTFDKIREIPEIADGIFCHCGCAALPGYRSLLICYEDPGMAKWCEICQGEGNLTYRLHKAGKTLDQIRAAIDAKFG